MKKQYDKEDNISRANANANIQKNNNSRANAYATDNPFNNIDKTKPIQKQANLEEDELLQGKFKLNNETDQNPIQQKKDDKNSSIPTDTDALAFTQGDSVHFAPGQFKPETKKGQELIGHEFAHVVQQREGKVKANKQIGKFPINDNKDLEKQADEQGKKAADGVLQRKEKNVNATKSMLSKEDIWQKKEETQVLEEKKPTIYKNEKGIIIATVHDGGARTYIIADDKLNEFNEALNILKQSNSLNNKDANTDLGEKYGKLSMQSTANLLAAAEFRDTKGRLIYTHEYGIGVSYVVNDAYAKEVDYKIKKYEVDKAYLDKKGKLKFSFKTIEENVYYHYNPDVAGYLDKNSRAYKNLTKHSKSNFLGNEKINLYDKDMTIYSVDNPIKKLESKGCSHASYLRTREVYNKLYKAKKFPTIFYDKLPNTPTDFYKVWNVILGDKGIVDAPSIPLKYRSLGATGALEGSGMGKILNNKQIWEGGLKPGANMNWVRPNGSTHSFTFLGYSYDEKGNIEGFNYWDHDTKEGSFELRYKEDMKGWTLRGVNFNE